MCPKADPGSGQISQGLGGGLEWGEVKQEPLGGGFQLQCSLATINPSISRKTPIRELKGKCRTNKNGFLL